MSVCFSVCISVKLFSAEAQLNADAAFIVEDIPLYLLTLNAEIKSLRATLPDETFYWGFCFLNHAFR
jgi:hypothetical protein